MWSRAILKDKAKKQLRNTYWYAFVVSLILNIAGGSGRSSLGIFQNHNMDLGEYTDMFNNIYFATIVIVTLFAIAFRIFVAYSLQVSGSKFFIENTKSNCQLNNLGFSFKKGQYLDIVKTMFVKSIFVFLWTLLLIVPGIIKSYAYRMVPYILAENPNIDTNKALELSDEMTKGHKLDIFILDLSFLGWYLLGVLACGMGVIFVRPYQDETNAELYNALKQNMDIGQIEDISDFEPVVLDDQRF